MLLLGTIGGGVGNTNTLVGKFGDNRQSYLNAANCPPNVLDSVVSDLLYCSGVGLGGLLGRLSLIQIN